MVEYRLEDINILKVLPKTLFFKGKDIDTNELFNKTTLVGLYFGAKWCPPCQGFNPVLKNLYKKINENEKVLEIIYCSSDEDVQDYVDFLKNSNWPAINYNDDKLEEVGEVFGIEDIPQLLVFNSKGKLVDLNGRKTVQKNGINGIKSWLEKEKK